MDSNQSDESSDQAWLDARHAFDAAPENTIVVDPAPKEWHRLLAPIRTELIADVEKWKARQLPKGRRNEDAQSHAYSEVNSGVNFRAGCNGKHSARAAINVSFLTYSRALTILNTVLYAAEARNCSLEYSEYFCHFRMTLDGALITFSIRERQEVVWIDRPHGKAKKYLPTDRLAISGTETFASHFELADKPSARLEERLFELFDRLYSAAFRGRPAMRKKVVNDELKKVQDAAYEAVTVRRALEAKEKAEQQALRATLIDESEKWQLADRVRMYVRHVLTNPQSRNNGAVIEWSEWAVGVAEDLDPSIKRIALLSQSSLDSEL
jgi:hypothetical protein